jgi:hypothetical protein
LHRGPQRHRGHREEETNEERFHRSPETRDHGAAVISAHAFTFAGANVKEKTSACSVRNDGAGGLGLFGEGKVLLDELEVGLAVGDRQREGIGCEDVERHAFLGDDLMFGNAASLLIEREGDIAGGQAT